MYHKLWICLLLALTVSCSGSEQIRQPVTKPTYNPPIKSAAVESAPKEDDRPKGTTGEHEVLEQSFEFVGDQDDDGEFPPLDISIIGPNDVVEYGDLVDLQVKLPQEKPANFYGISYSWTIIPPPTSTVSFPDRSRVVFGTGMKPVKVTAILTASYVYLVKSNDVVSDVVQRQTTVVKTIEIGQGESPVPPPTPPTPPTPPGPPQPDLPNTASGLQRFVAGLKNLVNASPQVRTSSAKALAQSYRGSAAAIVAGAYRDDGSVQDRNAKIKQIINDVKVANQVAVDLAGTNVAVWKPMFEQLATKMSDLYQSGYNTQEKLAELWIEIANGLETY